MRGESMNTTIFNLSGIPDVDNVIQALGCLDRETFAGIWQEFTCHPDARFSDSLLSALSWARNIE